MVEFSIAERKKISSRIRVKAQRPLSRPSRQIHHVYAQNSNWPFESSLANLQDVPINTMSTTISTQLPMTILYAAGTLFLYSAIVAGYCPVQDSITPCACIAIEEGLSIECKGQENSERIPSVILNLETSENLELILESLTLPVLASFFKDVSLLHLHDAHIEKLKPNSSFVWPKLSEVQIEASSIAGKPVPNFKEARVLNHLEINKVNIPRIGSEFRESVPDTLTYLAVRKTKTTILEAQALGDLKNLQYFFMIDLPLAELPRDVLPQYLPDLHTFILVNTKIETLQSGFFDGMPKLEVLMLSGNKLITLDHSLFVPVEEQLTHLVAERNPLVCGCNLLWLRNNIQKKRSMKVLATCNDDVTLKRKEVISLNESEYCS